MKLLMTSVLASLSLGLIADVTCLEGLSAVSPAVTTLPEKFLATPSAVFPTLKDAIDAQKLLHEPVKQIPTGNATYPEFPSYSACEKSFFRVATINETVDGIISNEGWKSGWVRRADELKRNGQPVDATSFDALPPTTSLADRVVEYVRVKNRPSQFPKHSSVVGVLENPIRTLSVGYHTGFNSNVPGNHMRMDEIEVGPCAKAPECQSLTALNSTQVFADRKLEPRYSTEGEYAVDSVIPPACIVATYRLTFQKVDTVCYSDANSNCDF